jgi:two-component system cell cycle response regulator
MPHRILVIEDNADNLELMTYLLQAFGHTTFVATDGSAGLELALLHRPDLILCDIQMPGMNGYQVARALQRDPRLAAILRVAVTALAMVGDREKVLAAGFDGYIAKPIVPYEFVPLVEGYLCGSRPPAPPAASLAPATAAPPTGQGPRILVVDDLPVNRSLIRRILEPSGYRVVEAANAYEALAAARRDLPALILCDVHMPVGDGYECIRLIRADPRLSAIPFVFLSSTVFAETVRCRCLKLGAVRFLARPVEPETLRGEIEAVLTSTPPRACAVR